MTILLEELVRLSKRSKINNVLAKKKSDLFFLLLQNIGLISVSGCQTKLDPYVVFS